VERLQRPARSSLLLITAWNRDRARPFRWTFTGYPLQAGPAMAPAQAA
jgi:hypothetical protein